MYNLNTWVHVTIHTYSKIIISGGDGKDSIAERICLSNGCCVGVVNEERSLEVLLNANLAHLVTVASWVTQVTSLNANL